MRNARRFAALCFFLAASGAQADRVDDYVRAEMAKQQIPGLSLAVVRAGKLIKAKGYGLANLELRVPARPQTAYKIASVSKQFVAAGILLLVQDGKIALDDPIDRYFDDGQRTGSEPLADRPPEGWSRITVRHLLTMTSGLPRELPGWSPYKEFTEVETLAMARQAEPQAAPGERWAYCNLGYFLLALIIHRASGQPWGDFLRERIFEPLGMTGTRLASHSAVVSNRADGYVREGNEWRNAGPILSTRPSGGLLSTVLDLVKWDAALASGKLLTRATLKQAWTPVTLHDGATRPYGFGWALGDVRGHRVIEHGGSLAGFRSQISRFVDDRMTVIILTNSGTARPKELARGVAAHYVAALRADEKQDERPPANSGLPRPPLAPDTGAGRRSGRAAEDHRALANRRPARHNPGTGDPRHAHRPRNRAPVRR
jgi:CubicO group peptidase (beta-lactamase class C family)